MSKASLGIRSRYNIRGCTLETAGLSKIYNELSHILVSHFHNGHGSSNRRFRVGQIEKRVPSIFKEVMSDHMYL